MMMSQPSFNYCSASSIPRVLHKSLWRLHIGLYVSPKLKSLFRREFSESNFGIHGLTFIPFHPLLAWFTILFLFPFSFVIDMSLMELIQTWGEPLGTFLASIEVLGFSYSSLSSFKTKSAIIIWSSFKKKTRRIVSSHRLKYFKKEKENGKYLFTKGFKIKTKEPHHLK